MRRFIRYGTVGALATATHYALLVLVVEAFGWPAWLGSGLGAVVGAQVAYAGNRRWTFGHRGRVAASWPRFQATALLGALAGMAIVAAGVRLGLHYLLAQVVATGAGLLLTFAVNRRWTFGAGTR
jgi:putative flippase GtrA